MPDLGTSPATDLPVRAVLAELLTAVHSAGTAVLVAPPGTGKTTLVPLALAGAVTGRVLVAEPRRVAARAAAARMAELVGGPVGAAVGYSVRGERRVRASTRVEVVTTGLLVARLQRDPDLPGVDAVVIDECHERHLDSDLALAFAVDVRATLRPDLALLAMSATAAAGVFAARLAGRTPDPDGPATGSATGSADHPATPVIGAETARHPVEVVWCPGARRFAAPLGARVDPGLLDHVASTVRRALRETTGDVLVFLPGIGEIKRVAGHLAGCQPGVEIVPLHGRQPAHVQDAALCQGTRRRVVLASAVAESSLTVPGVRVVVDAGLSRVPRTDLARGLGSLATVRVSRASARQRAGRAGREAPGRVYRCWSTVDHERLAAQPEPEVAVADLTGFALHLACWGHPDGAGLALPDRPPAAALEVARATLLALGAVTEHGRATDRGRAMADVGAHPRLARALLDGARLVGANRAAQVVALLAEDGRAGGRDDLVDAWQRLRGRSDPAASARWRAEVHRLRPAAERAGSRSPSDDPPVRELPDDLAAGLVVGLAFPERLARARRPGAPSYLMTGGTAAELSADSAFTGTEWLAVAVADREPGRPNARIRLATAIDEATAREVGAPLMTTAEEVTWSGRDLIARGVDRLGCLVLAERRLRAPDRTVRTTALLDALRTDGLATLRWNREARHLRDRLAFCHHTLGDPWPDVSDQALLARAPEWLGPELANARHRDDLRQADLRVALRRLLAWPQAARLDEVAPPRLPVPGGAQLRVDYADPQAPVLAVAVQAAFGWSTAPTIGDGRVPVLLHLLSPAGRPVAVTRDLASFWRSGYLRVRAELRGRYPRHRWPEDPFG
ncbi:MAG: ATP-dependent helicase HrpB [Dactylosporangium sp.]|nr:ATP-dependent helicase HrpB [Dactylosporangium sp.]